MKTVPAPSSSQEEDSDRVLRDYEPQAIEKPAVGEAFQSFGRHGRAGDVA